MKKVLLIFAFIVSALAAKAVNATVYVQADEAPYLYGWFTIGGKETKINGAWPGKQLTEKTTKKNAAGEDMEFWFMTFNFEETSSFNIIFNNGNTSLMKQTGNITDIASDRYFTYDGESKYTDITEDFGVEIPDVEIQSVALISELNEWNGLAQLFKEEVKNAKYTYNLQLTDEQLEPVENYYRFKIMVNSSAYLDWNTEGMTRERFVDFLKSEDRLDVYSDKEYKTNMMANCLEINTADSRALARRCAEQLRARSEYDACYYAAAYYYHPTRQYGELYTVMRGGLEQERSNPGAWNSAFHLYAQIAQQLADTGDAASVDAFLACVRATGDDMDAANALLMAPVSLDEGNRKLLDGVRGMTGLSGADALTALAAVLTA